MKLDTAIEELHRSENHLVTVLLSMSDRHKTDHEVFYVCRDMAKWSRNTLPTSRPSGGTSGSTSTPEGRRTRPARRRPAERVGADGMTIRTWAAAG
jgi:hypothetical protein